MRHYLLSIITLILAVVYLQAREIPDIWYHPDSLISQPQEDSILWTDEYTIFSVVKSQYTDSVDCLWSFTENDTVISALLTNGVYIPTCILQSRNTRDFSKWCIYANHSGIRMDSLKSHTLRLGEQIVETKDSSGSSMDTLHARISMEEFAYFRGYVPRRASAMFQTYLALKYGITLDYAPYLSCYGDTLLHPIADEDYYHRVMGIGNDTLHGWYSTLSQSKENATLHIAIDSLIPNEYVLLGDDGGEMEWRHETIEEFSIRRQWRLRTHTCQPHRIVAILEITSAPAERVDSLWMNVQSEIDGHIQTFRPDSVLEDSLYCFTFANLDTITRLSVCCVARNSPRKQTSSWIYSNGDNVTNVVYDNQNKTITISGFSENQMFDLFLYNNAGQFLTTTSSRNPVNVTILPQTVSYIEIMASGQIVGSVSIPIQM